jgi:hypothetical protein
MKTKIYAILNLIGLGVTIYVNYLANALPINGKTTGELSDAYPNLFVPAGFTFAIWGVIYLLLLAFVVYSLVVAFGKNEQQKAVIDKIGIWFFISCIFNSTWIFAWHYQEVLIALGLMLGILITLIIIYQRLNIGNISVSNSTKFLFHVPFSVYLGWITVATIANVTTYLVDIDWDGSGILPELWTVIVLLVGTYIGQTVTGRRRDIAYGLVIIWAYYGIVSKRMALGADIMNSIVLAALIGMGIISLLIIIQLFRRLAR